MSHELRTRLNAILGMSEILREQVFGPINKDQLDSLKQILVNHLGLDLNLELLYCLLKTTKVILKQCLAI